METSINLMILPPSENPCSNLAVTNLQQSGLMLTKPEMFSQHIGSSISHMKLKSVFPDFSSEEFSHAGFNKLTRRKIQCYYCKKFGHKISTCRYKRRRDIFRKSKVFPAQDSPSVQATNQEAICCSLAHENVPANMDVSLSIASEKLPFNKAELDLSEVEEQLNDLHSEVTSVITHHDTSSVKLKEYNLNANVWKLLSLSWLGSLFCLRNPFCFERCKQEFLWLVSFAWLTDLLSFFKQKHVAGSVDDAPRMVAYCTIDSHQPLKGTYNVQSTQSVPTWKRKKKKRR